MTSRRQRRGGPARDACSRGFPLGVGLGLLLTLLTGCGGASATSEPPQTDEGEKYKQMLERTLAKYEENQSEAILYEAIRNFRQKYDRLPSTLDELVSFGVLIRLPKPPDGMEFTWVPEKGRLLMRRVSTRKAEGGQNTRQEAAPLL